MRSIYKTRFVAVVTLTFMAALSFSLPSTYAQEAAVTIQISVKNNRFQPAEIHIAANKLITLTIKNLDPTPMEFESVTLRVEKVVVGNGQGIVRLRALSPGRYDFFDDFHPENRGTLVVQ